MTLSPEILAAADFECVHFTKRPPDAGSAAELGVEIRSLDGEAIASKQDLMAAVAAALDFPHYFGGNWDALDELLRDLPWLESGALALVVHGAGALWRETPELAGTLVSVWLRAAGSWAERETGFHLVFAW